MQLAQKATWRHLGDVWHILPRTHLAIFFNVIFQPGQLPVVQRLLLNKALQTPGDLVSLQSNESLLQVRVA